MIGSVISKLLLLTGLLVTAAATAQPDLIEEDWRQLQSQHFTVISQVSERRTRRFANQLESWRWASAYLLAESNGPDSALPWPTNPVPNIVYLFDDIDDYQLFVNSGDAGYFVNTPRANYMVMVAGNAQSFALASHHYAHFLLKNFADLSLPRWYEEGMAAYMARMQIDGNEVEHNHFSRSENATMVSLSENFPLDRLLYQDDALASPRVIQIANLKAESLLHYLLHAYEEDDFIDRRGQLSQYLELLRQGRNPRFAFDRAFDVTTVELEQQFHNYLLNSRGRELSLPVGPLPENGQLLALKMEKNELALMLAELGLNLGEFSLAEAYFRYAADNGSTLPRVQAGIGDALRMQEMEGMDQFIAEQFVQSLTLGPDDVNALLDFGEYWEAELLACDKPYPPAQRQLVMAEMATSFKQALQLDPDNPEANLAMAQYYLLPEQQWQQGVEYQRRAFASLPADTFIMEQAVKYAIAAGDYDEAHRLIAELAAPIHFWGEPEWVQALRVRLLRHQRGEKYDPCDR